MKVTVNNKQYLATLTKTAEFKERLKTGENYQCVVKDSNSTAGVVDFFYDKIDMSVDVEKFKANDFDSANALFSVLRVFCFKHDSMIIESDSLTDANGNVQYKQFLDGLNAPDEKNFLDNLESPIVIDKSTSAYYITLMDDEEILSNVEGFSIDNGKGIEK